MKTLEEAAKDYSHSEGIYNEHGERLLRMGFVKGANYALENQWHDLRENPDDLPNKGDTVLVATRNGKYAISNMYIAKDCNGKIINGKLEWKGSGMFVDSIIAWMPIPNLKTIDR